MFLYFLRNQWLGNRAAEKQKIKKTMLLVLALLFFSSLYFLFARSHPRGFPPRTEAGAPAGGGPQEAEGARGRHGREAQEGVENASNFAKILMDTSSRNNY